MIFSPNGYQTFIAIGITAGASAPDILVQGVIARLQELGADAPEEMEGIEENVVFSMPKELRLKTVDA